MYHLRQMVPQPYYDCENLHWTVKSDWWSPSNMSTFKVDSCVDKIQLKKVPIKMIHRHQSTNKLNLSRKLEHSRNRLESSITVWRREDTKLKFWNFDGFEVIFLPRNILRRVSYLCIHYGDQRYSNFIKFSSIFGRSIIHLFPEREEEKVT